MFILIVFFVAAYHNNLGFGGEFKSELACHRAYAAIQQESAAGHVSPTGHVCVSKD